MVRGRIFSCFGPEVQAMQRPRKVLRSFESALNEPFVTDHFGGEIRQFAYGGLKFL
jgi:hypothetical protein